MPIQGTSDMADTLHRLDSVEPWVSISAPGVNNDAVDTAGIGKRFIVGSIWIKTTATAKAYHCVNNTAGAAVWV